MINTKNMQSKLSRKQNERNKIDKILTERTFTFFPLKVKFSFSLFSSVALANDWNLQKKQRKKKYFCVFYQEKRKYSQFYIIFFLWNLSWLMFYSLCLEGGGAEQKTCWICFLKYIIVLIIHDTISM